MMNALKDKKNVFVNPLAGKNIGRRTGKNIKAGRQIRQDEDGYENFNDYWSESDADTTRDTNAVKDDKASSASSPDSAGGPSHSPRPGPATSRPGRPAKKTTVGKTFFVHPLQNDIGRRTGKDIKAGKNIRKDSLGFENFDDYWSESDLSRMTTEAQSRGSLPSFTKTSGEEQDKEATEASRQEDNAAEESSDTDNTPPSDNPPPPKDLEPVCGSVTSILSSQESQPSSQTDTETTQEVTGTVKKRPSDATHSGAVRHATNSQPQAEGDKEKDDSADFYDGMTELECASQEAAPSPALPGQPVESQQSGRKPTEVLVNPRVAELRSSGRKRPRSFRKSLRFEDNDSAEQVDPSEQTGKEGEQRKDTDSDSASGTKGDNGSSVETNTEDGIETSTGNDSSATTTMTTKSAKSAATEQSGNLPTEDESKEAEAVDATGDADVSAEAESDISLVIETDEESEDSYPSNKTEMVTVATETVFSDSPHTESEVDTTQSSRKTVSQTSSSSTSRTKVDATSQITPSLLGADADSSEDAKDSADVSHEHNADNDTHMHKDQVTESSIDHRKKPASKDGVDSDRDLNTNKANTEMGADSDHGPDAGKGVYVDKEDADNTADMENDSAAPVAKTDQSKGALRGHKVKASSRIPVKVGPKQPKDKSDAKAASQAESVEDTAVADEETKSSASDKSDKTQTHDSTKTSVENTMSGTATASDTSHLAKLSTSYLMKTVSSKTATNESVVSKSSRLNLTKTGAEEGTTATKSFLSKSSTVGLTRTGTDASRLREKSTSANINDSKLSATNLTRTTTDASGIDGTESSRQKTSKAAADRSKTGGGLTAKSLLPSLSRSRVLKSGAATASGTEQVSTQSLVSGPSLVSGGLSVTGTSTSHVPNTQPSIYRGGDLNGSLVVQEEQNTASTTSPLKSFGTRKRLSYTLAEETDATDRKMPRSSRSTISSIPESIDEPPLEAEITTQPNASQSNASRSNASQMPATGAGSHTFLSLSHHVAALHDADEDAESLDFYIVNDDKELAGKKGKGKRKVGKTKEKAARAGEEDQVEDVQGSSRIQGHRDEDKPKEDVTAAVSEEAAKESNTKGKRGRPKKAAGKRITAVADEHDFSPGLGSRPPQTDQGSLADPQAATDHTLNGNVDRDNVSSSEKEDVHPKKARKRKAENVRGIPSKTEKKNKGKQDEMRETADQKTIHETKQDAVSGIDDKAEESETRGRPKRKRGRPPKNGKKDLSSAKQTTDQQEAVPAEESDQGIAFSPPVHMEEEEVLNSPSGPSVEGEVQSHQSRKSALLLQYPARQSQSVGTSSGAEGSTEEVLGKGERTMLYSGAKGLNSTTRKSARRGPKRKISFSSAADDEETDKGAREPAGGKAPVVSPQSSGESSAEKRSRMAELPMLTPSLSKLHSAALESKSSKVKTKAKPSRHGFYRGGRKCRGKRKGKNGAAEKEDSRQVEPLSQVGKSPREPIPSTSKAMSAHSKSRVRISTTEESGEEPVVALQANKSSNRAEESSDASSQKSARASKSAYDLSARDSSSPLIQVRRRGRRVSSLSNHRILPPVRVEASIKTSGSRGRNRRDAGLKAQGASDVTTPTNASRSYVAAEQGTACPKSSKRKASVGSQRRRSRWATLPHITPKSGVSFRRSCFFRPDTSNVPHAASLSHPGQEEVAGEVQTGRTDKQRSGRSAGLTPCLTTGTARRGRDKRRVTICEQQPSPAEADSGLPSTSALDQPWDMEDSESDSPVHYCETTHSRTPCPKLVPKAKIIYPEPAPPGLRRSKRVRVQGLEWYKNEQIVYGLNQSGFFVESIQPSKEAQYEAMKKKKTAKRKLLNFLRKEKKPRRKSSMSGNLSMHTALPENMELVDRGPIPVVNPENNTTVFVDCLVPFKAATFLGPKLELASGADPFVMTCMMRQRAFTSGHVFIQPLAEKPKERVVSNCMVFTVLSSVVLVTIHQSATLCSAKDVFFVPMGSSYTLKNMRNEQAQLFYVQLLNDESEELPGSPADHLPSVDKPGTSRGTKQ